MTRFTRGAGLLAIAGAVAAPAARAQDARAAVAGEWRAALDLAGGELRFRLQLDGAEGVLCNAGTCQPFSAVTGVPGAADSVVLDMADYAAAIRARVLGDSLVGFYRNVGNRGPRTIPFRASRGTWPAEPPSAALIGTWDATFNPLERPSPRVIELRATERGLEGTIISNSGDYGVFWGDAAEGSFDMAHFDGSFVYMLTGTLDGDTLRGTFHAGLRTQTPFVAVRSTGRPHLTPPTEVVRADTTGPFTFAFPSVDGTMVSSDDPRFRDKVVIVEIFGTWCPTCHESAPAMVALYERYRDRGLEIVGMAYEVTGDSAVDGAIVRRYRDKFGITFPLLLAGVNDGTSAGETQPQLAGPIAFPTTIFLDRTGRVRKVHAGFYGPATGTAHEALLRDFRETVEGLLAEGR
ncbi:MAG: TlpA family protein disulfide reductase [Gemmatimonadota bacterium]|nr:TlpA family protein disulfide reductase [Gemmatimonadota bacterium]MDH5196015.1 TlpA family protein disulfide reductase [Gemmatimonadota bacterium]